jgi:hypothetical protein
MLSMKKLLSSVAVIFCLSVAGNAQQLTNATRQCWSGGIAGRHGCNYHYTLLFSNAMRNALPDKVWIDGQMVQLEIKQSANSAGNVKKLLTKKGVQFEIAVGTQFNDQTIYPDGIATEQKQNAAPPIKYAGIALISYKLNGKTKYFVVKKIYNELPDVNYP